MTAIWFAVVPRLPVSHFKLPHIKLQWWYGFPRRRVQFYTHTHTHRYVFLYSNFIEYTYITSLPPRPGPGKLSAKISAAKLTFYIKPWKKQKNMSVAVLIRDHTLLLTYKSSQQKSCKTVTLGTRQCVQASRNVPKINEYTNIYDRWFASEKWNNCNNIIVWE